MQLRYFFKVIKNDEGYIFYQVNGFDKSLEGNTKIWITKANYKSHNGGNTSILSKYDRIRLNNLKSKVDTYILEHSAALTPIDKEELQTFINNLLSNKPVSDKKTVYDVLNTHYALIDKDKIKNNGKPYSDSYKRQIHAILEDLQNIYLGQKNIKKIIVADLENYADYMFEQGLMQGAVKQKMMMFKNLLKATVSQHGNHIYKEDMKTIRVQKNDNAIALSVEEIKAIYELQLPKKLIPYRDKFVYGCNIGLRFSDLSTPRPPESLQNGILAVWTKKTGKSVYIPMTKMANEIWDKYQGNFPITTLQAFHVNIRKICRLAEITEQIVTSKIIKGKTIVKYTAKCDLVTSHTMRRSCATNLLLAGFPPTYVQKIMAHSQITTTMGYDKSTSKQIAERAKELPYFKQA